MVRWQWPTTDFIYTRGEDFKIIPNKPGLYRIYDIEGQLIYIGKSAAVRDRIRNHFNKLTHVKDGADEFNKALITFERKYKRDKIMWLESYLINKFNPKYNKKHNPKSAPAPYKPRKKRKS